MEFFYVLFLSIMIYLYSQVFRKERNTGMLTRVNGRSVVLFCVYCAMAVFFGHFLTKGKEFRLQFDYLWFGITYFVLMFSTCLAWRRKDEKFLNPFIPNNRWNITGILGTIQYSAVCSFLHTIPKN